jgi:hypothetical protein
VYRPIIEAGRFDALTHEVVVVSAWRGHTDWFRNIQANIQAQPALEIRVGGLRFEPRAAAARSMPWLCGIDPGTKRTSCGADVTDCFEGVSFRPVSLAHQQPCAGEDARRRVSSSPALARPVRLSVH